MYAKYESLLGICAPRQFYEIGGAFFFAVEIWLFTVSSNMNFKILDKNRKEEVAGLFTSVFSSAEGEKEGRLIGSLAAELSANIDNEEIICFGAYEEKSMVGSIFFTRLRFDVPILVYMLAPVAVSTEHQAKGVGQALINFGLNELKNRSVAIAVTYGDPSFYAKAGFQPLPESVSGRR
ncbi:MAG: GNAT family N-acetyltransferase [Desulfobacteraceae bacterium]|nr:GNAT family N-acetyltransferase [Desulfobacteraceae bacterium]